MDRPGGRRVLRFDGAFGPEGCCGGFAADDKVSVTGLAFWWEISRLRVSSKRFPSNTHTGASPPLEMPILAGTPIVISTVAERSGEISRLNGQESGCGFRRWLCRRVVREKVDGPPARGFLRFLSLTRLRREGCCGGFAADLKKRGAAGAAGCVEGLCPHRGNDSL